MAPAPAAPRPITIERQTAGRFCLADAAWPELALISRLDHNHGSVTHMGDSFRIELDNGAAVYRCEEYMADRQCWCCRLVEGHVKPAATAAETAT